PAREARRAGCNRGHRAFSSSIGLIGWAAGLGMTGSDGAPALPAPQGVTCRERTRVVDPSALVSAGYLPLALSMAAQASATSFVVSPPLSMAAARALPKLPQ